MLDTDQLIATAKTATGLAHFGEGFFRDNAKLLIDDVVASQPTAKGVETLRKRVMRLLENRLRVVHDRETCPEIARQKIQAPIIVLGLPRSGTTFLHALLAQNPTLRAPLQWEVGAPSPPPRAETYATDSRIAASRAEMSGDAGTLKLHIQDAELPVECGPVLAAEFMNTGNYASWDVPNYLSRVTGEQGDAYIMAAYHWHRQMLQHFQAFTKRDRWVLKSPQHIGSLGALLTVYPDAVLVFTHRDPVQTLPSLASLVSHFRTRNYETVDTHGVGRTVQKLWSRMMNQCLNYRDSHPEMANRVLDVPYQRLIGDPMGVAREVHDLAGISPGPGALAAMEQWAAENRQDRWRSKHGEHKYSAKDFGLDQDEIATLFADYRGRFTG